MDKNVSFKSSKRIDMKKTYLKPELVEIEMQPGSVIATSFGIFDDEYSEEGVFTQPLEQTIEETIFED
jgi:hypothetical protein